MRWIERKQRENVKRKIEKKIMKANGPSSCLVFCSTFILYESRFDVGEFKKNANDFPAVLHIFI